MTALGLAAALGACTGKKDTSKPDGGNAACTEEAKVCPDGSSVGRTGANCEFAECPAAADGDATPTPEGDAPEGDAPEAAEAE
jgi:hypothetical protein